ncbi:MAG: hypothetical protein M1822_005901 [Bathelium mastoideum]|nr:MAG: hypothetical protein M1822_005901 [Bathelium mastoideum]
MAPNKQGQSEGIFQGLFRRAKVMFSGRKHKKTAREAQKERLLEQRRKKELEWRKNASKSTGLSAEELVKVQQRQQRKTREEAR